MAGEIVVDAEDEVSGDVEDGEAAAVEEKGFGPHGQRDRRVLCQFCPAGGLEPLGGPGRAETRVYFCHFD